MGSGSEGVREDVSLSRSRGVGVWGQCSEPPGSGCPVDTTLSTAQGRHPRPAWREGQGGLARPWSVTVSDGRGGEGWREGRPAARVAV